MVCERCEECRRRRERFCRFCGDALGDSCSECEVCRNEGVRFCSACGRPLTGPLDVLSNIVTVGGIIATCLLTLLLLFETAVMIWGIPNVLMALNGYSSWLIVIVPALVDVVRLDGVPLQIYYILLVMAVLISVGYASLRSAGPVKDAVKGDISSIRNAPLFEICVLFSALYIIELVIIIIADPNESISFDSKWIEMFELLEAPVWEEIITRVLYISVPVMIVCMIRKTADRPAWHYLFGGWKRFDTVTVVFILFSALMFGLAHYLGSWGAWKILPTFLFGLIAGYLFVKYGVYTTICIHFLTDYISSEMYLLDTSTMILTALIVLFAALVCIPYVYIYAKKGLMHMSSVFRDIQRSFFRNS